MATVRDIIRGFSCSTEGVKGLSLQVIDEMNLLIPGGVLVSIDDLDISGNDGTVNLFMQPKAKEALRRAIRRGGVTLQLNSCYRTVVPYIQQVIWVKKYLSRKNEGFRDRILNSKFFIEY